MADEINVLNNTDPVVPVVPEEQKRINVSNIPPKSIGERELDGTVLTETSTNTITNKILTSPVITTPTVTTPTVSGGTFTSPTLSNPSVTGILSVASAITQSGTADHIVLTPGTSKLVKMSVIQQDNTTNTYKNSVVFLTGWGFVTGDGVAASLTKTVTFGITFAAAPIVLVSHAGYKDASDPTAVSDSGPTNFVPGNVAGFLANTITTTAFDCTTSPATSTAITNARRFLYTWVAIGTL